MGVKKKKKKNGRKMRGPCYPASSRRAVFHPGEVEGSQEVKGKRKRNVAEKPARMRKTLRWGEAERRGLALVDVLDQKGGG